MMATPAGDVKAPRKPVDTLHARGVAEGADAVIDRLLALADALRRAGIDVSTGDVVDAGRALGVLELGDRQVVRVGLRAVLIKHETDLAAFDRGFRPRVRRWRRAAR